MLFHFRYHSTNCFFVASPAGDLLAFDCGWPLTLFEYFRNMKAVGLEPEKLRFAVVSHFHLDHAGLVGELQARGVDCLSLPGQSQTLVAMEKTILKSPEYRDYRKIDQSRLLELDYAGAKAFLAARGFAVSLVNTPGHTDESLSLFTAEGDALIGDLAPLEQLMPDDEKAHRSWDLILDLQPKKIWPSHAPPIEL